MKNQFLTITLLLILGLDAWAVRSVELKVFKFQFKYHQSSFTVEKPANSYDEAFAKASVDCFNHFTNTQGEEKVSESVGLPIIDTCANPEKL